MRKSSSVAVTAVAAVSMAIACGQKQQTAARVCADESGKVVPAELCERRSTGSVWPYFWYYHAGYARSTYPATGTLVRSGGRFTTPAGAPVARGGFGATASGRSVTS